MKRTGTVVAILAVVAFMLSSIGTSAVAQMSHGSTPDASPTAGHDSGHDSSHGSGHGSTSMGAFYMTITNNGDEADRLVAVESGASEVVEIHNVEMDGNVMHMIEQEDGVEIPAGETLELAPGGYHVMLIGLTESLLAGEAFTATLIFEHAGEVEITVPILMTEPDEDELTAEPVEAGDLVIEGIWARQAPKLDGGMGTPAASPVSGTPESTPAS